MRQPGGRKKPGQRPDHVPLERALSKLGIASRTQAREWIVAGRLKVNGALRTNPLFSVHPESAIIELDGKRFDSVAPLTLLLYKPKGVITTRSDEKGRPTVYSLLKGVTTHLGPVGRLDWATSGLLLLTNNTKLSSWLTDPANAVIRRYLVSVRSLVTEEDLEKLKRGIEDEGELLQAENVTIRKASRRESHLTVELTEGKNREIRRMFLALGNEVTQLKRVAYGGLELGDLEPGQYREVASDELVRAFPKAEFLVAGDVRSSS